MFADVGVLNYWTYLLGAIFIILVPGPNTFFVLKTGAAHGIRCLLYTSDAADDLTTV